jgi:7-cyano-7-deazaguanine synthase in queuosine biosynthesis
MKSVVLFSGGLDSYATLVLAKEQSNVVAAVHVRYGQPHGDAEFAAAELLVGNVPLVVLDAPGLSRQGDIFVGRNPILLTLAASVAAGMGVHSVWAGFCQADAEAFPDCRVGFIAAQEMALRLALDDRSFTITAPLLFHTKGEIWDILARRDLMDEMMTTHTCYRGVREPHPWGFGCGECNACKTRMMVL